MVQADFRSSSELPLELSVSLLSADHLFWAQSSSLVITYCQEALPGCWLCLQTALPSPSPGGGPRGGLTQGKAPGIWAVSGLVLLQALLLCFLGSTWHEAGTEQDRNVPVLPGITCRR